MKWLIIFCNSIFLFICIMVSIGSYGKLQTYYYGKVVEAEVISVNKNLNYKRNSLTFKHGSVEGTIKISSAGRSIFIGDKIQVKILEGNSYYLTKHDNPWIGLIIIWSVFLGLIILSVIATKRYSKKSGRIIEQSIHKKQIKKQRG